MAILGAGLMGHAIAAILIAHGHDVTCVEPEGAARASLPDRVNAVLAELGRPATGRLSSVSAPTDLDPSTGFITEAAPEQLELKQTLLAVVAQQCPKAVLASNSSVFCVADVGRQVADGSRVVGTHWWNPPHLIPLVEVVQGERSDPVVVAGVMEFLTSLGKTTVHVRRDTPGFIGNRLQHALWREAMALVDEGVCDAAAVDLVVKNSIGLRLSEIGPLANADYVGLDLTRAIHEYVFPTLSRSEVPLPVLDDLVERGALGAKTGSGFFDWPPGVRHATAARLAARVRLLANLAHDDE